MAADNRRTPEEVRLELESQREGLAQAVDTLRSGFKEATDVKAKVRANLPLAAAVAVGAGFLLAGGIGATMRLFARRDQETNVVGHFGRFTVVDRGD